MADPDTSRNSQEQLAAAIENQAEVLAEMSVILKGMSMDLRDILREVQNMNAQDGGGLA